VHGVARALWSLALPAAQSLHAALPAAAQLPAGHGLGAASARGHCHPASHCTQLVAAGADRQPGGHGSQN